MQNSLAYVVLLAGVLGLAACEKTTENNEQGDKPTNEQAQGAVTASPDQKGEQELAPAARASDQNKPQQ
ncbi:hypothetical protein IQ22_03089 [Pseudomonas duriflava]|uniref:Uncharacterized protein n=1 Tax=Pseudomonas duriflava TaxID=459528 RepID=A0A562Q7J6_9PSED|nr:hypothetical protein [Pseudomonas duriflava]TWI52713.1 hypothetical protein IQ22_03089 [Pseudomonas duriflava]